MRKSFVILGVLLVLIGLLWPWLMRGNWWKYIGHLPGDIHIEREGFSFHFPLMTCILVSLLVSGVLWLLRR